jgi:hypothetical protein
MLVWSAPRADQILGKVAENSALRHATAYSGWRQYSITNQRFSKSASATVRITSEPGQGKQFTITGRVGSTRLLSVIESLLSSEVDAGRPRNAQAHEIGPSNYSASVLGGETVAGHDCWVVALTPKTKSKYLLNGTAWIEKKTFGIVRLEGTTAASVSQWVGTPHIVEDFTLVDGVWLPLHTVSKSNSFLLGESDLDIQYTGYEVKRSERQSTTHEDLVWSAEWSRIGRGVAGFLAYDFRL